MRRQQWPEAVDQVLVTLEQAGYDAYLVGGCVRDLLLGRPVHDYDVATSARPDQVCGLFARVVPTGIQHGTVTVLMDQLPVEVTTYRVESAYSDGRRPDAVTFTPDVRLDLSRRDFTVNAIALHRSGRVVDPFEGRSDAKLRTIRAVGTPTHRFREDSLRILRALRFSAQLNFHIDPGTRAAMHDEARGLRQISLERIGQEFARLATEDWWEVVSELAEGPYLDWLPQPMPQLRAAFRGLTAALPRKADWQDRFCAGNWTVSERQVVTLSTWICVGSGEIDICHRLVRLWAWPGVYGKDAESVIAAVRAEPNDWDESAWRIALFTAKAPLLRMACMLGDWLQPVSDARNRRLHQFEQYLASQPLLAEQDLRINGAQIFGLGARDRTIGDIKRTLIREVLLGQTDNQEKALLARAKQLVDEIGK